VVCLPHCRRTGSPATVGVAGAHPAMRAVTPAGSAERRVADDGPVRAVPRLRTACRHRCRSGT
jgi:hypothetical protein